MEDISQQQLQESGEVYEEYYEQQQYESEEYYQQQQQEEQQYNGEIDNQEYYRYQESYESSEQVIYHNDREMEVGESGELEVGEVASINSSSEGNFKQETESNNAISESVDVSSIGSSLPEDLDNTDTHRNKLVKEVISSERNYLHHLNTVIQLYLEPLKSNRPAILETEYIQSIFSCIEKIKDLSEEVLADLVETFSGGSENVGKPFISRRNRYQDYIVYGKNHGDAIDLIGKLNEKKPSFVTFLQSVRDNNKQKLDLPSYLIMPVQRMPRIKLLLQEILEETEPEHVDYNDIKDALDMISSTTKILNEEIRKHENKLKVQKIQNELVGGPRIITDNRVFVREGAMMKVCRKVPKSRWFFLFSDALIYTSATIAQNSTSTPYQTNAPTSYTFHRMLSLNDIKIKDLKDKDTQKNAFQIISSTEKSFTVYTETPKEKNNWLEDFKLLSIKLINENQSQNIHDLESTEVPVWVPDKDASKCMFCNDYFTVINRRHHCRNCGKVVCGSCSPSKKLLPHVKKSKPVRVCLFCYDYISMNEKKEESFLSTSASQSQLKTGSSSPQLSRSNTFQKLLDGKKRLPTPDSNGNTAGNSSGGSESHGRSHSIGGTLRRLKHLAIKPSDQVKTMKEKEKEKVDDDKNLNRTQSEPYLIMKSKIALPIVGGPPPKLESNGRRSTISSKNNSIQLSPTPPAPNPILINRKAKEPIVLTPTPPAPTSNNLSTQDNEQPPAPPARPIARTSSQPPPPQNRLVNESKNPLSNSTTAIDRPHLIPNKSILKPVPQSKRPLDSNGSEPTNPTLQRKSGSSNDDTQQQGNGVQPPVRKLPIKPLSQTGGSEIIKPSAPLANPKRISGSEIMSNSVTNNRPNSAERPLPTPNSERPLPTPNSERPLPTPNSERPLPTPQPSINPKRSSSEETDIPQPSVPIIPRRNTLTKPVLPNLSTITPTPSSEVDDTNSQQQQQEITPPRKLSNGPLRKPAPYVNPIPPTAAPLKPIARGRPLPTPPV